MLNEQHMPLSVGNVVKMAEQDIGMPFHSQYLRMELPSFLSTVIFLMSKQGKVEYHSVENMDGKAELASRRCIMSAISAFL
jgi:hypothetical protein